MTTFAEFLATAGVHEELSIASTVGVMALHGGLEFGTTRLARRIASEAPVSVYAVVQPSQLVCHVSSIEYDRRLSRPLHTFLSHVRTVFSFHGYHRPAFSEAVILGGRNRPLAHRLGIELEANDIPVIVDLDEMPKALRGQHERNPVNLPDNAGVQIELPRKLRRPVPVPGIVAAVTKVIGDLV